MGIDAVRPELIGGGRADGGYPGSRNRRGSPEKRLYAVAAGKNNPVIVPQPGERGIERGGISPFDPDRRDGDRDGPQRFEAPSEAPGVGFRAVLKKP